jgi:hypothetical protein
MYYVAIIHIRSLIVCTQCEQNDDKTTTAQMYEQVHIVIVKWNKKFQQGRG